MISRSMAIALAFVVVCPLSSSWAQDAAWLPTYSPWIVRHSWVFYERYVFRANGTYEHLLQEGADAKREVGKYEVQSSRIVFHPDGGAAMTVDWWWREETFMGQPTPYTLNFRYPNGREEFYYGTDTPNPGKRY